MNLNRVVVCLLVGVFGFNAGFAQTTSPIRISAPADGATVSSGATIFVIVETEPGLALLYVQLAGDFGYLSSARTTPPYTFTVPVPNTLVGQYGLTAIAVTSPGNGVFSSPISIVAEPTGTLVSLSAGVSQIQLQYIGQTSFVSLLGEFDDGRVLTLRRSSNVLYGSSHPDIVSVSANGTIVAVRKGHAVITASYGTSTVKVRVSVTASGLRGDLDGDGDVDQDDLNKIRAYLNQPAGSTTDARDLNGDGRIDALDARIMVTLCTRARCANGTPE